MTVKRPKPSYSRLCRFIRSLIPIQGWLTAIQLVGMVNQNEKTRILTFAK